MLANKKQTPTHILLPRGEIRKLLAQGETSCARLAQETGLREGWPEKSSFHFLNGYTYILSSYDPFVVSCFNLP